MTSADLDQYLRTTRNRRARAHNRAMTSTEQTPTTDQAFIAALAGEAIQRAYDLGDFAEGQRLNVATGLLLGGSIESGGAVKATVFGRCWTGAVDARRCTLVDGHAGDHRPVRCGCCGDASVGHDRVECELEATASEAQGQNRNQA